MSRGTNAMQPAHNVLFQSACPRQSVRSVRRGLTLIELLVASLILTVSLMALVATWFNMLTSTVDTGDRGAAYQCARLVLERAHVNGFTPNIPQTMSNSDGTVPTAWSSPNIIHYRYFSPEITELLTSSANDPPAAPQNARYLAKTEVSFSTDAPHTYLNMMTVRVTVFLITGNGNIGPDIYELQTCLTIGGV